MLLDETKIKYEQLLETIIANYTYEYNSTQYDDLFEACFRLADFINQAESKEYLNEHSLRTTTALYVTKSISDLIDKLELSAEHDLDCVRHAASWQGTRMHEAFSITQKYFESDGLFEMIGTTVFYTNFKQLADQL